MKVGDYVRTERFGIREIHDLRKNGKDQIIMVIIRDNQLNQIGLEMEYIKKHSPNLIDLIEDGDYVNGMIVDSKKDDILYVGGEENIKLKNEDIKEILTKQQYEKEVLRI